MSNAKGRERELMLDELAQLRAELHELSPYTDGAEYGRVVRRIRELRGIEQPSIFDAPQPEAQP